MKKAHKGQFVKRKNGYYHYIVLEESRYGMLSLKRTDINYYLWEPMNQFVPAVKKKSELTFFDYIKGIPVIILGMLATACANAGLDHFSKPLMERYYRMEYKLVGLNQPGKAKESK